MKHVIYIYMLVCGLVFSSCNDYLDIVPKGNKIPSTLADYEALLRDEYAIGQTSISNALYLLNDYYVTVSNLNSPTLTRANYMWDETADRILLNNADESTYYQLYAAISSCNLIVENVKPLMPNVPKSSLMPKLSVPFVISYWQTIMPIRMMRQPPAKS